MEGLNNLVGVALLVLIFANPRNIYSLEVSNNNALIDWNSVCHVPICKDSVYCQSYYENLLVSVFHKTINRDHDHFSYQRVRIKNYGDCFLVKCPSTLNDNLHTFILLNLEKQEAKCFCATSVSSKKGLIQLTYNIRGRISHTILEFNSDAEEIDVIDSWREWIDEDKVIMDQIMYHKTHIIEDSLTSTKHLSKITTLPETLFQFKKRIKQREVAIPNMGKGKLVEYDSHSSSNEVQNKIYILYSNSISNDIYVFNFDKIKIQRDVIVLYYKQRKKRYSIQVGFDNHSKRFFRIDAD